MSYLNTKSIGRGMAFMAIALLFGRAAAQCPEITIDEKYDHAPSLVDRLNHWDTLVNCRNRTLTLHATPFITTQHFNGTYLVESIPYNPPDTTFHAGTHLSINTDDAWDNSAIQFPFTFMFFGKPYTSAVVGSNGLVSFNLSQVGQYCAYNYNSPIPLPVSSFCSGNSHNAIYGVYEDIHPIAPYVTSTSPTGMFRSIGGTYPCRYLCASVNQVPLYPASSHANHLNSYQIICYEGTNIIEVHVKQRYCCSSTNAGKGLIGIQNETGVNQVSHYHDVNYINDYTYYIEPNSPGAFVAPGRNGTTDSYSYEAWRFTPQGETQKNISWWRLFEDANGNIIDSVEFTNNPADTNGFYLNSEHTIVSVTPTRTTKYLTKCIYRGANNYLYGVDGVSMRDIITVGMDTATDLQLSTMDTVICEGQVATVSMTYSRTLTLDSCEWSAKKEIGGQLYDMPRNALTSRFTSVILNNQAGTLDQERIDTVWVYCNAGFSNGCKTYDSIMIRTYPNFNFYDTVGICDGETYRWNGETYREAGDYSKHFWSEALCDSTRHLHLVVSDLSYNVDYVEDCKPFTWVDGRTYTESNDATRLGDTVRLQNRWGCDSVVTLNFTFIPMKAIITHDPEVATLDQLTIELTDASYGHDSRLWLLPDGTTSTNATTYINFPLTGIDTLTVRLAVHNEYGCDDTARADVLLHKISEFVPNAFTPGRTDNNRFAPNIKGNITDVRVWIYDRRGIQVAFFEGPDGYWDGKGPNGEDCPQGTYVYILRYRNSLEPTLTQESSGTITLIR